MKKRYLLTIFILFISFISSNTFSQKIENVQFKQEGKKIIITYDLFGATSAQNFDVVVEISEDGGVSFAATPKTLLGDAGAGVKPGTGKKITWDVLNDIAELHGGNIIFKVVANGAAIPEESVSKSSGGGIPTWVWIGGGVVVAGGAAAILLSGSKKTEETIPDLPDNSKIVWPPK
jgi:hypothetical protein